MVFADYQKRRRLWSSSQHKGAREYTVYVWRRDSIEQGRLPRRSLQVKPVEKGVGAEHQQAVWRGYRRALFATSKTNKKRPPAHDLTEAGG